MMDPDLQDLIAAWHGAEISDARYASLLDRLRADPGLRRAFADEITILSQLKAVRSASPRWLRLAEEMGAIGMEARTDTGHDDDRFSENVMARIHRSPRPPNKSWRHSRRLWLPLAAALVIVGLVLALLRPPSRPAGGQSAASADAPPLAVLTSALGVRWDPEHGQGLEVGSALKAGELRATEGGFSLSLLNGVTLSAEAPVHLDLRSTESVRCLLGKVRVRVPPGAEGFAIDAPTCTVVDRGTEFGLNVDTDQKTDVMVFDGEADVFVGDATGSTRVSTSLARSQAVRVGPGTGKAEAIEARPHDFAPLFPPAAIPLELSSRYSGAVLASGPWGYWRFEDDTDTVFRNEIAGGPVIRATGDIARRAAPGSNHWLVFPGEGKDAGTHALMDDVWPRSRDPRYAIELWFDAENFANSTLVALLGTEKPLPHNNHLGVIEMRANRQEPGGIRFLHRWPAGPDRGVNISSHQIYFPCRWTHLVAQCDGSRLQLILDGVPVAESPLPPDLASGPCHVLLGRLVQPSFEPTKSELFRLFRGGLDELALYDRPLSLEEIKTHIQAR